jgi:CheY-like chemotaxis protein
LRERAERNERFKHQFLANMSHEIRTPMNAIMGMTGILRRNQHPPEQDKYLDAIAQSSENLLVILNDILDLSKFEAGAVELEMVPFDVRKVIGNVEDIVRFRAEAKGLVIEVHVNNDVPNTLIGDPTRLNQILVNLTGNAVKFTEAGKVSIAVSMPKRTDIVGTLQIDVTDTGIGIPPDKLDRIFEEFTQAYADTTRKYGGTGLGLTISKRLVELQGGTITVRSSPDQGSTFTVSIPYAVGEERAAAPSPRDHGMDLCDLRILLAEDNEFNVMVAQDELADAIPGVRVDVAANGRIAVEMARAKQYDVILMDVQMPEMNGYDATRAIRSINAKTSKTPIIAMTANVMEADQEFCAQAGMIGHIPKPFTREELVSALRKALTPDTSMRS